MHAASVFGVVEAHHSATDVNTASVFGRVTGGRNRRFGLRRLDLRGLGFGRIHNQPLFVPLEAVSVTTVRIMKGLMDCKYVKLPLIRSGAIISNLEQNSRLPKHFLIFNLVCEEPACVSGSAA